MILYFNTENKKKLLEAIKAEARKLGIRLVAHGLDRTYDYNTDAFEDVEHLTEEITKDIKGWFSSDNLAVKEMCVVLHNDPFEGECVRVHVRCKR